MKTVLISGASSGTGLACAKIGSISGINSYSKGVVYSTSKASVKSILYGLRKELVDKKIKITNIQPTLVDTNISNVRLYEDNEKAKEVYDGVKPLSAEYIAKIIYLFNLYEHVQINEISLAPIHHACVEVVYRKL